MGKRIEYVCGERVGPSGCVFIKEVPIHNNGDRKALFECGQPGCDNKFITTIYSVKCGNSNSCGCYQRRRASEHNTTHGMADTPLYLVWESMRKRCRLTTDKDYHHYGGRGITVCDEWEGDFMAFYKWSTNNGYKKGLTIDRIDNDGPYAPSNCRWTTQRVQVLNSRMRKTNTSGYVGVGWLSHNQKWIGYVRLNGKQHIIGYFKDKKSALDARNNFIIENKLSEYKTQEWRGK